MLDIGQQKIIFESGKARDFKSGSPLPDMSARVFPSLPAGETGRAGRNLRICIVTSHFAGPAKTAGLGTAYMALGEALAADGHDVTVLYLRGQRSDQFSIGHWIDYYRTRNITLVPLGTYAEIDAGCPYYIRRPYEAYLWMKDKDFDVIHYSDCYGIGYYIALAKHQRKAFTNSLLCVGTHGSTMWLNSRDVAYPETEEKRAHIYMERQSIGLADVVVSPSQFMLNWLLGRGVKLPSRAYVQQNILPDISACADKALTGAISIRDIVFFGRLEKIKGIELFCDACDQFTAEEMKDVTITFLGNPVKTPEGDTSAYIEKRATRWPFAWQSFTDLGHAEAQQYVQRHGVVAVIPSLVDNSPYAVLECLGAGVPFLASRVGGIPELIGEEDVESVCFTAQPEFLTKKIRKALREGIKPARPAVDFEVNKAAWIAWHRNLMILS